MKQVNQWSTIATQPTRVPLLGATGRFLVTRILDTGQQHGASGLPHPYVVSCLRDTGKNVKK